MTNNPQNASHQSDRLEFYGTTISILPRMHRTTIAILPRMHIVIVPNCYNIYVLFFLYVSCIGWFFELLEVEIKFYFTRAFTSATHCPMFIHHKTLVSAAKVLIIVSVNCIFWFFSSNSKLRKPFLVKVHSN